MRNVAEIKEVATWTKIIAAIIHYQNNHRGLSPTDEMIAIESGVSRDVVRSQMREMEKAGLLTDSKRWPRLITIKRDVAIDKILDVVDPKQVPVATSQVATKEEPMAQHHVEAGRKRWEGVSTEERSRLMAEASKRRWPKKEETVTEKRTDRVEIFKRMPFFERAKQIAHLIDEHADRYGVPPSGVWLREQIAKAQGVTDRLPASNLLSVAVTKMVEEGWLDHKAGCHADFHLTNLGRATLLHSGTVEREVMKQEPVIDWPAQPPLPKPPPRIRPETAPTAHPAIEKPPLVTIRGYRPERPPAPPYETAAGWQTAPATSPDLSNIDSLDLAMELQRRGWRVMR